MAKAEPDKVELSCSFARLLAEELGARGVTAREFARAIGVRDSHLSRIANERELSYTFSVVHVVLACRSPRRRVREVGDAVLARLNELAGYMAVPLQDSAASVGNDLSRLRALERGRAAAHLAVLDGAAPGGWTRAARLRAARANREAGLLHLRESAHHSAEAAELEPGQATG